MTRFVVVAASAGRVPAWAVARSRAGFKSLPGGGGCGAAARCAGREGGGGCCSKMADEAAPLLRQRDGGPGGAAESAEPAPKRQRLDSEDGGCGRGPAAAQFPERGAGPPPVAAVAVELPGEAAAVPADGGGRRAEEEDDEAAAAAVWSGADNRAGLWGLPRAEPPPRQRGRGEGAEAAPGEDAAEAAIGCRRAQCSNGAAGAPAPHPGEDPHPLPPPGPRAAPRSERGRSGRRSGRLFPPLIPAGRAAGGAGAPLPQPGRAVPVPGERAPRAAGAPLGSGRCRCRCRPDTPRRSGQPERAAHGVLSLIDPSAHQPSSELVAICAELRRSGAAQLSFPKILRCVAGNSY